MARDWSRLVHMLRPLAWGGAVLAASRSDTALEVVPALGTLRGPLGLVLAAVAAGVAAAHAGERGVSRAAGGGPGAPGAWVRFAAASALFLTVGLLYASRLRVSGDEPHYLLMAQSLWREGDLDLRDNLERGDFLEYTPGPVAPHYGAPRRDGRPFPAHGAGLPALIAPLYAAGGRRAVVVLLALAAAAVAALAHRLSLRITGDPRAARAAWVAALGPPSLFYSFHVYTEVPSAAALAGALALITAGGGAIAAGLAGLLAGGLPWLHVKMAGAAAAVAAVAGLRLRGSRLAAFAATFGGLVAGLALHHLLVFGQPTPLAVYGGVPRDASGSPLRAAGGLLLDRSFGLLPHAPVFLLALPGVVVLARRHGRQAGPLLAAGAAALAPVLVWRMWWGGQCPPGRFLVPLVPVLAVGVASCVERGRGLARWLWPLSALGLGLGLVMTARPGDLLLLNRGDRPTRVWAALGGEAPVGRYLPSFVAMDRAEARVAVVWLVALAVVLGLDALARRSDRADRLFGGLGLPLGLLLGMTLAVDRWARAPAEGQPAATDRPPAAQIHSAPACDRLPRPAGGTVGCAERAGGVVKDNLECAQAGDPALGRPLRSTCRCRTSGRGPAPSLGPSASCR